eukprot:CAMPEP_0194037780 /NCGR_PEP_ID=MMETSP0009_2-20130614/10113_1 /TAXON_ID=210454 /ORGANISM="Grammatophora oceanica, Strain CCMP 410" /LENGTH=49 /DNA_ID=CAMNT_0038680075 /DNA_START=42 /DNA_END=191 /DNA_ORIENTATION=-
MADNPVPLEQIRKPKVMDPPPLKSRKELVGTGGMSLVWRKRANNGGQLD